MAVTQAAGTTGGGGLTTLYTVVAVLAGLVAVLGGGGLVQAIRYLRKSWQRDDRIDLTTDKVLGNPEKGIRYGMERKVDALWEALGGSEDSLSLPSIAEDVASMKRERWHREGPR